MDSLVKQLRRKCFILLLIWVFTLSVLYSTLSVIRHDRFQSGAFDLGIFDQEVWQYAHLQYPYNTIKERFILGDHLNLILPILSPLYYLWSDVRVLLILQAVFVAISVIPMYLLITKRGFSELAALLVSITYSLFYGFQFAVFFDFHPIILGVGLLAWFLYFYESKRWKWMWVTLVLMLLTQENMGIALACVGFIYLFHKEHRRNACYFIFGGIGISLIEVKIVGLLSPVGYQYQPVFDHNPFTLFANFFNTQDKRLVWLYTLSSFSFLPLFSPAILSIFFDLTQYFLPSKQFGHMTTPFLHHRAILAVFVLLGTLEVLTFIKARRPKLIAPVVLFLFISMLMQQFVFHFPLNKLSKKDYWKYESWMADDNRLFKTIPKNASLAAAQNIVPHLSQRNQIYVLWPRQHAAGDTVCGISPCWWLDFIGKPQYMVIDLHQNQWVTQLLESNEHFGQAVRNMENKKKIVLVKRIGDARLYRIMY